MKTVEQGYKAGHYYSSGGKNCVLNKFFHTGTLFACSLPFSSVLILEVPFEVFIKDRTKTRSITQYVEYFIILITSGTYQTLARNNVRLIFCIFLKNGLTDYPKKKFIINDIIIFVFNNYIP